MIPIIIVTGPSGAGKSTVAEKLFERQKLPLRRFITCTTRAKRPGERHGREYWFLSREEFEADIAKDFFFEYANVYGNYYGSSKKEMERLLKGRKAIFMVIDVQGARTVKKLFPQAFVVFLDAPKASLVHRLEERGTDPKDLKRRSAKIATEEKFGEKADLVIVNEDGELTQTIAKAEQAIQTRLLS